MGSKKTHDELLAEGEALALRAAEAGLKTGRYELFTGPDGKERIRCGPNFPHENA